MARFDPEPILDELEAGLDPPSPTAAYLSLETSYPAGGRPHTKKVRLYLERLEDAFLGLADRTTVSRGIASVDKCVIGGAECWRESFCLHAASTAALKPVADRATELVRTVGFPPGFTFALRLRSWDAVGKMVERVRPVTATGAGRWRRQTERLKLWPPKRPTDEYPERLTYLAGWAERCDGVGGNDIWGLFAHEPDLQAFLAGLAAEDRAGLVDLYKQIVRRKDNEWLLAWMRQAAEEDMASWPTWVDKTSWLFAVLDRLRKGGLLAGTRGKARRTVLVYWDDYCEGDPHLAAED